jgi:lipopolysaccharide transport system ATP-binding protein
MLKLLTGNFASSSGEVKVNGSVQALMSTGLAFHPEFTGYENVRSALVYNGLNRKQTQAALADIIEFVELDQFLHQPIRSYSKGMRARLEFAAATAIIPDILIVDEVLGAGDAYFSAKSAARMHELANSGCTLLLVSHSMQQMLQFCDRAVWIEAGKVVLEDEAIVVVKAYEEFAQKFRSETISSGKDGQPPTNRKELGQHLLQEVLTGRQDSDIGIHGAKVTPGGISRWKGERGLKIRNVRFLDRNGAPAHVVHTGDPVTFEIDVVAEESGRFGCRYHFNVFTMDGRLAVRHCSEQDEFHLEAGQMRTARMHYPEMLFGNGQYVATVGVYKHLDLSDLQSARLYDLLSRCFQFEVVSEFRDDESLVHHPCEWVFQSQPANPSLPQPHPKP